MSFKGSKPDELAAGRLAMPSSLVVVVVDLKPRSVTSELVAMPETLSGPP